MKRGRVPRFGATQWTEALKYNGEDMWKTPKAFGEALRAKFPVYKGGIPYQVAESAVAVIAYQKAIDLSTSDVERRYLKRRLAEVSGDR